MTRRRHAQCPAIPWKQKPKVAPPKMPCPAGNKLFMGRALKKFSEHPMTESRRKNHSPEENWLRNPLEGGMGFQKDPMIYFKKLCYQSNNGPFCCEKNKEKTDKGTETGKECSQKRAPEKIPVDFHQWKTGQNQKT
ncbi:hypothetical protein [Desulfobotulus alkaliphilus]|uniref:hypothetical protein n=1 Tax=Desulfobotulus alkaliphilus TaxID=622671 RepID=UPI001C9520BC|nr:hypothetical protein [Desulfobotulus alkaliphilus]